MRYLYGGCLNFGNPTYCSVWGAFIHMRLDMRQDWELLKVGNVGNVGNKVIMRPMKE